MRPTYDLFVDPDGSINVFKFGNDFPSPEAPWDPATYMQNYRDGRMSYILLLFETKKAGLVVHGLMEKVVLKVPTISLQRPCYQLMVVWSNGCASFPYGFVRKESTVRTQSLRVPPLRPGKCVHVLLKILPDSIEGRLISGKYPRKNFVSRNFRELDVARHRSFDRK
jgi:hypothetical protein